MTVTLARLLDADWARLAILSESNQTSRPFLGVISPRFAHIALLRVAQILYIRGWKSGAKALSFLNYLIFGLEVPARLQIGPGLVIPHPNGTILGAGVIGSNVTIFQQVTLGAKTADFQYNITKRPRIGDGVTISAGAKILGGINVGDNVIVGANAVVLCDVPPECLAVGIPARIIRRNHENEDKASRGVYSANTK